MYKDKIIKKGNTKFLVAGVVVTILLLAVQTYASTGSTRTTEVEYGEKSIIEFNPGDGPDLSYTEYQGVVEDYQGGILQIEGNAGHPLNSYPFFDHVEKDNFGAGERPIVPNYDEQVVEWPGYSFEGWENTMGNKVDFMPYAFQYVSPTTYTAIWDSNSEYPFDFTIMHYRDLDSQRGDQWPAENDNQIIPFMKSSWTGEEQEMTNTPISASYRRDIPGYKVESVLIKNNHNRKFIEESGAGTLEEVAKVNSLTKGITGNMPNDDLMVAYRYEPNPDIKFPFIVRHVDESGTAIESPNTINYAVETLVTASPLDHPAYIVTDVAIVSDDLDDLDARGVYSTAYVGGGFDENKRFAGKMPNQEVIIEYQYQLNPNYETSVVINVVNDKGELLEPQRMVPASVTEPIILELEEKAGYSYPPIRKWSTEIESVTFNENTKQLEIQSGIMGGVVNITYVENPNDTSAWARVEYYHNQYGSLQLSQDTTLVRVGTYPIEELTAGVITTADNLYEFDGWYLANSTATGKTGSKLTGTVTVNGTLKLFANFEENPDKWHDLTFVAGANGALSGTTKLRVPRETLWEDLNIPTPVAGRYYQFKGWYNQADNKMMNGMKILADQTYTAKFTTILPDDGMLSIPDVIGEVLPNGNGQITVKSVNTERKYVVTDEEGVILSTITNFYSADEKFTTLVPGTYYYVYELSKSAVPQIGELLSDCVDETLMSQPAKVGIPSVGSNYLITNDSDPELKRIVIKPLATDTLYALLDEDGNPIIDTGAKGLWVGATGSSSVTFVGLEPGTTYIVVAKHKDSDSQQTERASLGTRIHIPYADDSDHSGYTLAIANGGYIAEVERNGEVIEIASWSTQAKVQAGDRIIIDAPVTDDNGEGFEKWQSLIGGLTFSYPERRRQTITMPDNNVILSATYESSNASGVTVDFSPRDGQFALNMQTDLMEELLSELTDNADDMELLSGDNKVEYVIKLGRRNTSTNAELELIKEIIGTDDNTIKSPWALDISLSRTVNGMNKSLPADGNITPAIQVYGSLDASILGNSDYQLWRIQDEDGDLTCTEITMTPDPNGADSEFTGVFLFEANVGDTIILTYSMTHEVTIIDAKRGTADKLKVESKTALEDAEGYAELAFHEGYVDNIAKIVYEFVGLGTTQDAKKIYDVTKPVTKNLELYVLYEEESDDLWQQAKKKLEEEIDRANALKNNSATSEENRDILRDAINDALVIRDQFPRASVEELEDAYQTLKAIVDSIKNGDNGSNGGGNGGGNNGGSGGGNSGGSSGGSGGSGGGGSSSNGLGTIRHYSSGLAGQWLNTDLLNHQWIFRLSDGTLLKNTWAQLVYESNGVSRMDYYYFGPDGVMISGWLLDEDGKWYYLSTVNDGWYGHMLTGWHKVGDKWYYFNSSAGDNLPTGALYINGVTPDGYRVNTDGVWEGQ